MIKLILVLFITLVLSCTYDNKSISNNDRHLADTLFYFFNNDEYTAIIKKDSLLRVYAFDANVGIIRKCVYNLTDKEIPNCETYISNNLLLKDSVVRDRLLENEIDIIQYHSNNSEPIDSLKFWEAISVFLDSTTLVLPKHKFLLDQTYSSSSVDQSLIIDSINFTKNVAIDKSGIPKLFFDVIIDRNGAIRSVEYNSWGKDVYEDLIVEIKRILLTKATKPYKILGYPLKVKMTISVVIRSGVYLSKESRQILK